MNILTSAQWDDLDQQMSITPIDAAPKVCRESTHEADCFAQPLWVQSYLQTGGYAVGERFAGGGLDR